MVDSILLKLQVLNEEEKLNKNLELIEEGIEKLYNEGSISLKKAESLKDFIAKLISQEMDFLLSEPEEYFDLYTEDDDIYDSSDL
tara:strand:+ start:302 stop:556 length:255 start_codon:yes stop_codon:yes gene_type:complete